MRVYLRLTPSEIVPYDHYGKLVGTFHRWMGKDNPYHNQTSLYSLSGLAGIRKEYKNGFVLPTGATWFISSPNHEIIHRVMLGAMHDDVVGFGMRVSEVRIMHTPEMPRLKRFMPATPVLVKRFKREGAGSNHIHYVWSQEGVGDLLTKTMERKMRLGGIQYPIKISFDDQSPARVVVVPVNGIKNLCTICPVQIEGDPRALQFAWDVGVGSSTGCCFGALE